MKTTSFKTGSATTKGRRKQNEDSLAVLRIDQYYSIVVTDGMGGHLGGATASRMAVEEIQNTLEKLKGSPEELIPAAVTGISRKIFAKSIENESLSGMGSTLAMVLSDGFNYWIFHVGDSRIYLANENNIQQLTTDHTVVEDSIQKGLMTEEEALKSRYRHAILQCLGHEEDPECSVYGPETIKPGTVFLACSDGLSNFISEIELLEVLKGTDNPDKAAEYLLRKAYHKKSDDNISVAILEFGSFTREESNLISLPPIRKDKPKKTKLPFTAATLAFALFMTLLISSYFLNQSFEHSVEEVKISNSTTNVTTIETGKKTQTQNDPSIPPSTSDLTATSQSVSNTTASNSNPLASQSNPQIPERPPNNNKILHKPDKSAPEIAQLKDPTLPSKLEKPGLSQPKAAESTLAQADPLIKTDPTGDSRVKTNPTVENKTGQINNQPESGDVTIPIPQKKAPVTPDQKESLKNPLVKERGVDIENSTLKLSAHHAGFQTEEKDKPASEKLQIPIEDGKANTHINTTPIDSLSPSSKVKIKNPLKISERIIDLYFNVVYSPEGVYISDEFLSSHPTITEKNKPELLYFCRDNLKSHKLPQLFSGKHVSVRIHFEENSSWMEYFHTASSPPGDDK